MIGCDADLRELTDGEIEAAAGAFSLTLDLGFVTLTGSVTKDGASGGVKVGDGPWHHGVIWWDDLK